MATQVWQIEGGKLRVFRYGFAEHRRRRAHESFTQAARPAQPKPSKASSPKAKGDKYQEKKRQEEIDRIEQAIDGLEEELDEVEKLLATASQDGDGDQIATLGRRHHDLAGNLEQQMHAWEQLVPDDKAG